MNRGRRLGIEQYSNTRCSGCLTNPIRVIAARDRSGINSFAEDIGKYFDAPRPFVGQFRRGACRHPYGMRIRMAADHVTLASQEANLLRVQKALPVDLVGGDKKMRAPPVLLEKPRDTRGSAFPS